MSDEKNKGGAPTKYKDEYCDQAYKYCLLGATDKQLAEFFDIAESTLNNWKVAHPKFVESIKKGKQLADAEVASSLYHRAMGYEHPEVKVFNNQGEIITYDCVKHYAPDPTAAIFWLKNRQPKNWRDKQEIQHSGEINQMSDEELNKKLAELIDATSKS